VDASKLADLKIRLEEAIQIYQMRLHWLTSDSRRLFGVITESNVCLVLDCKQNESQKFKQFKNSILNLVCEQLSKINSFNIIRCGSNQNCESFKEIACSVTSKTIDETVDWINNTCFCHFDVKSRQQSNDQADTSTCEAVIKAFQDPNVCTY
jgi:hypothetical protein